MPKVKTVADVLESQANSAILDWLLRVENEPEIISVRLTAEHRCAHLPQLFQDLVSRLRDPLPLGTRALMSDSAFDHGCRRRKQGYTAPMLVEESRMLQVSIFETLKINQEDIDLSILLGDVMTIADEIDSQLAQTMASYLFEAKTDTRTSGSIPDTDSSPARMLVGNSDLG